MDHPSSNSSDKNHAPWLERQTLRLLGAFLPRSVRQRQIYEWQDQLYCTRATSGDVRRELVQVVRSTPSIAWTATSPVLRIGLPSIAVATMAALALWPAGHIPSPTDDYAIRLWDVHTRKLLGVVQGPWGSVDGVVFSPDNRTLAVIGADRLIRLWDVQTNRQMGVIDAGGNPDVMSNVAFDPRGRVLELVVNGKVHRWDVRTGKQIGVLKGRSSRFTPAEDWPMMSYSLVFSPDGRTLATGMDGTTPSQDTIRRAVRGRELDGLRRTSGP